MAALISGLEIEFGRGVGEALAHRFLEAEDVDFNWDARLEERWIGAYESLDDEDFVNSAAQSAGDALAAAALDPTVREAARERYIQSYVTALTPLFEACQSASREPFLSAHYVAGQGTLDWARRTGEEHWANSSGELAK